MPPRALLPPLLLHPLYRTKPWGGRRLATDLGRGDLPPGWVGESWEAVDTEEATSLVEGGPFDGRPLREVFGRPFPLLVKVLDAREDLSVQVHPDGRDGVPAKEEAWVALADGGAVATGVGASGPGRDGWLSGLSRTLLRGPRSDGDGSPTLVHVPAGTVHAILAGSLVWEVQTPVDVTWRLDDYGRRDAAGLLRPLHHREAAAVLARGPEPAGVVAQGGRSLRGHRFRVDLHRPGVAAGPLGLVAFFLARGEVRWRDEGSERVFEVPAGRTVVLPPTATTLVSAGWTLTADVR